jgi:hypothetical protein
MIATAGAWRLSLGETSPWTQIAFASGAVGALPV